MVLTLAARYFGAKTTANSSKNTKAYQSKFTATIPVVYPILAKASSIEGPTLVPHILKPMLAQPNDLLARKSVSSVFFFLAKLAL